MNRFLVLLTPVIVAALAGCSGGKSASPAALSEQTSRAETYSAMPETVCPGADGSFFGNYNNYYLGENVLTFPNTGNDGDDSYCYITLNKGEYYLCNAYAYLAEALSFNPVGTVGDSILTPEERLYRVNGALYFAGQATQVLLDGLRDLPLDSFQCPTSRKQGDASYHRYASALLADAANLVEIASREGAEFAVGISDGLRSTYGSFSERSVQVWGNPPDIWGMGATQGRRGNAVSWYLGLPATGIAVSSDSDIQDAPLTLPLCQNNASDPSVIRAVDVLLKYGVPIGGKDSSSGRVWTPWSQNIFYTPAGGEIPGPSAEDCLASIVTQRRNEAIPPTPGGIYLLPVTFQAILEQYDLTEDSVRTAALTLFDETRIRHYDLDIHDVSGNSVRDEQYSYQECYYLTGLDKQGDDIQLLEVRSDTGTYAVGAPGNWYHMQSLFGIESFSSLLSDNIRCMLQLDPNDCSGPYQSDVVARVNDQSARHQLSSALASLTDFTGSKYVDYFVSFYYREYGGEVIPYVYTDISLKGLSGDEIENITVYSVETPVVTKYSGLNGPLFRFMSCIKHEDGHTADGYCNVDYNTICEGESECRVEYNYFDPPPRRLLVITAGTKVIDVLREQAPSSESQSGMIRHYLDDVETRHRINDIIDRQMFNCAEPLKNSLGLRYDMRTASEFSWGRQVDHGGAA